MPIEKIIKDKHITEMHINIQNTAHSESSNQKTLNRELHIDLISGDFEPSGAADVLLSVINDKIRYHTVRSLKLPASQKEEEMSKKRVSELKDAKAKVFQEVRDAFEAGHQLEIKGSIVIRRKERSSSGLPE